jgi:hypothetical protein
MGVGPPFTGEAVKVILVLAVTAPFGLELMDTDAVTFGLTVTGTGGDTALQPEALVTVTEKPPLFPTTIDWVVAPVLHRYEAPEDAVSVTLPPWQNTVGPLGVIAAVNMGGCVIFTLA